MIIIILVIALVCVVFAYIPLTLVVIHSRGGRVHTDKYYQLKKKYWDTDYYGDGISVAELERNIDEAHKEMGLV